MSRKKIVALIMGALLAVGIIGGSLAYFTSQDMVQNKLREKLKGLNEEN